MTTRIRAALPILALPAVALLWAVPMAAQPASAPAASPSPPTAAEIEKRLDAIVAVEMKLGDEAWRRPKLARSTRKSQELALHGLGVTQRAYVVWPDKAGPAPVVMLLPEDQGLNLWARSMAQEIASMGYIVLVPDLLAGRGPKGGGRESFKTLREVFRAHSGLPGAREPELTAQLNFWADHAKTLAGFNGKLGLVGFAWGGGRAAWLATTRSDISALAIFYDAMPAAAPAEKITAPVYGFYAEDDPRVTRSLERTRMAMAQLGKKYEEHVYPGSEHMFVRLGDEPRNSLPGNVLARHAALARLQEILGDM